MAWIWFGLTVLAVWLAAGVAFTCVWCLLVPRVTHEWMDSD